MFDFKSDKREEKMQILLNIDKITYDMLLLI